MFDYYGSKNTLAKRYPAPAHGLIVEPFAGSAAYSMYWLSQNPDLRAVLVEKSQRVVDAWKWLKTATEKDLDELLGQLKLGERTTNFFIMASQASNAFFGCKYMTINKRMMKRFPGSVRRMKAMLPVMPRVEVVQGDYAKVPKVEATWFIDPPYQPVDGSIRGMGYDRKSGCTAADIDYPALGEWCRERKGQVIVCEQEGADWLPFRVLKETTNSQDKKYKEMIWTNDIIDIEKGHNQDDSK